MVRSLRLRSFSVRPFCGDFLVQAYVAAARSSQYTFGEHNGGCAQGCCSEVREPQKNCHSEVRFQRARNVLARCRQKKQIPRPINPASE
jgi:hypothetical protein